MTSVKKFKTGSGSARHQTGSKMFKKSKPKINAKSPNVFKNSNFKKQCNKVKSIDTNASVKGKKIQNEENEIEHEESLSSAMLDHNRKKKKSGGFQSMGLTQEVFRGIIRKGYKVPTPIQRKTIPMILEGRDVVAMARTGSGKTAAFLIPLFHKLTGGRGVGITQAKGARALILTPTRELALQTLKFTRELGRFTGLKSVCVLGGDAMEKQFALMHENPDIVIATPGRLVHLCVEMQLKLEAAQYVVFDEADRLFEMGFGEQLSDILGRLPESRQTVLFSATLPKLLVEFAKAGLTDPTLIRLDVDSKIPDTLKMAFFHCRPESKPALLLHVLQQVIPADQQVLVFAATRHHVEYLHLLLDLAEIDNTYIYSQLDSTARKINAAKFAARRARVLIVTDLAARGIDIPLLDTVINYHFPAKSKLFVHRVGRVARAGRRGQAYSFVAGDEIAYLVDLQLFLGSSLTTAASLPNEKKKGVNSIDELDNTVLGTVPQDIYDLYEDQLKNWHEDSLDLFNAIKVAANGYKQYLKSRPGASVESAKRVRFTMPRAEGFGDHPLLLKDTILNEELAKDMLQGRSTDNTTNANEFRCDFLEQMRKFRPSSTIFEIGNNSKNDPHRAVMSQKRAKHSTVIEKFKLKKVSNCQEQSDQTMVINGEEKGTHNTEEGIGSEETQLEQSSQEDITSAFGENVVQPKTLTNAKVFVSKKQKRKAHIGNDSSIESKKRKLGPSKDEENYIGYHPKDHHTEAG